MARRGNKQALALVKTTRAMKRLRLLRSGSALAAAIAMAGLTASPVAAQMAPGAGMTPNPRAVIVELPVETPRPARPGSPIMEGPQVPRLSLQGQAEPIRLLTPDDIRISGRATLDPPTIAALANRARPSAPTMAQDIRISGAATLSPPLVENIRISGTAVLPPSTVEDVRITTPAALPPAASPQPTTPETPPNQIAPATSGVAGINVLAHADFDGSKIGYTPGDAADIVSVNAAEAIINWTTFGSGAPGSDVTFLGEGSTLAFTSGLADYTVLNRVFTPAFDSAIRIDGSVTSTVAGGAIGGNVWFYSAGGIIVGATGAFDVGSLVLTTSQLDAIGAGGTQLQFGGVTTPNSGITIEQGASISASDYVALVAPRIEQHGTVSADGSVAYVAAEQAQLTIDNGLFDIAVTVGSEDANGLVHSGTTTGGAAVAGGDPRSMQMVGVSKNSAMTMLVGGNIGYQAATGATVGENGQIILTAGDRDSIEISNANLSGDVIVTAGDSISFGSTSGARTTAAGDVSLKAGVDGVSGGSIDVLSAGETDIAGNLILDASVAGDGLVERGNIAISIEGGGAELIVGGDLLVDASTSGAINYSAADAVSISVQDTGAMGGLLVTGDVNIDTSAAAGSDDIATRAGGVSVAVQNGALSFDRMVVDSQASATGAALGQDGDGRDYQGGSFALVQGEGAVIDGGALVIDSSAAGVDGKGGRGAGGSFDVDVSGGELTLDLIHVTNTGIGGNGVRIEDGIGGGSILRGNSLTRSFASRDTLISGDNAPQDTGFPSAGDGGDGIGGTNTMTLSAGSMTVADFTVEANGIGSDGASGTSATGTNGGAGGDGIGGTARFTATGGTLNVTNTLTVSATGNTQADQGVGGVGNGSNGGDGGQGIGGSATFLLDGTATITADTILVDASAYGGAGAASNVRPFFITVGFEPADNAGSGGDATGGTAVFTDNAGTLSFNSLVVAADAIAGAGGLAQTGGADPSEGGDGGNAQAGNATVNFNRAVNNDHDYFVIARAAGGAGGAGDIAGNGGNAVGGNATINVNNVAVRVDTAFVDTLAVGGAGGAAAGAGQAGGSGGNARAGTSAINITGAGADFSSIGNVTINSIGIGGDGGAGAADVAAVGTAGTGGAGGLGIGGTVEVMISDGANATLTLDDEINASGTGGDGGVGGDAAMTTPGTGGAGGNAVGGSISLSAESGATLTIVPNAGTVLLDVTADGGFGGSAGTGPLGSTFTQGANGAASGGAVDILADGSGSAISASGLVIADASATTDDDTRENSTGALARGGDISVRARDGGSLSFTSGLNFDASATAGSATIGGAATGGNTQFALSGGSAIISALDIAVGATGGAGIDGVSDDGGDGGDATGGFAEIFANETSTIDIGSISVAATSRGGNGGDGASLFAGGVGGAGTGGDIEISLLGTTTTLSDMSLTSQGLGGIGGAGGEEVDGGTGGVGQGGNITTVFGGGAAVIPTLADYAAIATGIGGTGGSGGEAFSTFSGGTGGTGGAGIGGSATFAIAGAGTTLDFDPASFQISADGIAGNGGDGGNHLFGGTAGNGGQGGEATGGTVTVEARSGTVITLPAGFGLTVNSTGGEGGSGGDLDPTLGGAVGRGGNGGAATGGTLVLRAVGGTIDGSDVQLTARGAGGGGGSPGADSNPSPKGQGNGGAGIGGFTRIETADGSPGIITLGSVALDATSIGGPGTNTGTTVGGQITITDGSADPLGLITLGSLTATATGGAAAPGTPSLTISSASGAVTVTGDVDVDVAGDIILDFDGDGQLVVGDDVSFNAGGDILLTHTGNTTPVNSLDIGNDFTATAGSDFVAGAGAIIATARETSITANNITFDTIAAGNDSVFDAGEFAVTLNAINGSITGAPTGELSAIAGMDLDATQAISVGDLAITDGPITIDAGTTLTAGNISVNQGGFVSNEAITINAGGDTVLGDVAAIDGLTVTSGGDLTATSLRGTGITATATGAVDIGDATIFNGVANGGDITISGASVTLDSADASTATGNGIIIDATAGDLNLGTLNAEGFQDLTATGDINFDSLTGVGVFITTTGGNVTGNFASSDRNINSGRPRDVIIIAPGDVAVTSFSTINDVEVTAASFDTDSIVTGNGAAGVASDVIVNVTGNARIGSADVQGFVDIDAGSIDLGTLDVVAATLLDSTVGDITIGSIITDGRVVANSAANLTLGSSTKTGTATIGDERQIFTAAGDLTVTGVIDSFDAITVTAGGAVDTRQLISQRSVTVTAGTTADVAGITTTILGTGNLASITGQSVTLGDSTLAGDLQVNATAGDISLGAVTANAVVDLDATGNITLTSVTGGRNLLTTLGGAGIQADAGGDIVFTDLTATDGRVGLTAGGTVTGANITASAPGLDGAADDATIVAGGDVTLTGTVFALDAIDITSGGLIDANVLTATDALTASATGSVRITDASTLTNDPATISGTVVTLDTGTFAGALNVTSTVGNIVFGSDIVAGAASTIDSAQDFLFTNFSTDNDSLTVTTVGNVNGISLAAATGGLDGGTDNLSVNAGGTITLAGTSSALDFITLAAGGTIDVEGLQASDGLTVTGAGLVDIASAATLTNDAASITGASVTLNSGDFAGSLTLSSTAGDIVFNTVTSVGAVNMDAAGSILGGTVDTSGAADTTFTSGQETVLDDIVSRILTITAGTDITIGSVDAIGRNIRGIAIDLNAGGTATFGSLISGRGIDVDAAAVVGGNVTSDNGVNFNATSISLGDVTVTELGGVVLDATMGNLVAGNLTSHTFGVDVTASGSVTTGNLGVVGTSNSSDISVDAGTDAAIGDAISGNQLFVNVAGNLTAGNLSSNVVSPGTTLTVGGDANIASFDASAGPAVLDIGGALTGGAFAADGVLTIGATSINIASAASDTQSVTVDASAGDAVVGSTNSALSTTVTATGLAQVGNAVAGRSFTIRGTSAVLNSGTITDDLTWEATGGDIDGSGAITVGGAIDLDATGNIGFGSLDAQGGAFDVDAGGDITFTAATSTASMTFNAGGQITADTLTATNSIGVDAGGAADLGTVNSGGGAILVGGSVSVDNGTVGNLNVTARTGDITSSGTVVSNGGISLDAGNDVAITNMTALGDSLGIDAVGDVSFVSLSSPTDDLDIVAGGTILGGDLDASLTLLLDGNRIEIGNASASTIDFTSATDILFDLLQSPSAISLTALSGTIGANNAGGGGIDTDGSVTLNAAEIDLGTVDAGTSISAVATGNASINNAISGTFTSVTGASAVLNSGTIGTDLTLNSTAGDIDGSGAISVGGAIDFDAAGNIGFGSLDAQGGAFNVDAGGDINFTAATSTDSLTFNAGGAINGGDLTATNTVLLDANSIALGDVIAGNIDLTSATNILFNLLQSPNAISLTATGGLIGANTGNGDIDSEGDITLSGQEVALGTVDAVGNLTVDATAGDATFTRTISTGATTLTATGNISVDHADTGGNFSASGNGDFTTSLNSIITGGDIVIAMAGAVDLGNSSAGGLIDVQGSQIDFASLIAGSSIDLLASDAINGGAIDAGTGLQLTAQTGSIALLLDGAEQILAGGSMNLNAGQNITITHTNNAGGIISLDSTGGISASARGGNIDAQAGSILSGTEIILLASGSVSADDLRAIPGIVISAGGNVTLNNAIATGPQGVSNFRGITIDAGQDPFGGMFYDNFANVQITGTVDSYADITVRAGGNVLFDAGSTTVADDSVFVQTGDDIIVAAGASLISGRNPSVAPDPADPFNGAASIDLDAGGLPNLLSVPATPIASLVVDGTLNANDGAIIATANAIDGINGNFIASSIALDINDAPGVGGFQDDDAGLLSANCFEGNICVGNIVANNVIEIGQASNNDVIQLIIEQGTVNANDILITTRNDIVMGTNGIVTNLSAANLFSATSTTGDVNLFDANISSDQILIDAAGSLLGTANLSSVNDIGITVGDDLNAASIVTDGELTSAANVGGALEGAFSVPGSLVVGTISVGVGDVNYSAGGDILIDNLVVSGTAVSLDAGGLVSLDELTTASGLTVTANDALFGMITTTGAVSVDVGNNADLGEIMADGNVQVDAGGTITGQGLISGGTLGLNGGLIAIGDANATNIDFTSASDILFDSLISPNAINLDAMAGVIGDNGGNGDIDSGGDVSLVALGTDVGSVIAGGSVTANATAGDASFGDIDATNDITITALGTPTVGSLTSGGNTSITGASVTLDNGDVGGDLALTATAGDIDGNGTVNVGGGIAFDAAGNVTFGSLDAQGGAFEVDAGGTIIFTSATAADFIRMQAGTLVQGGSIDAGTTVNLISVDIDVSDVVAGGDIDALADGGNLTFDNLDSGGTITLGAVGSVFADHAEAAGDFISDSGGNFTTGLNSIITGGDILITGDIVDLGNSNAGGLVDVTGSQIDFVTVVAGQTIALETIDLNAAGIPSNGNGNITGVDMTAGAGASTLNALNAINLSGQTTIGGSLTMDAGGAIALNLTDVNGGDFVATAGTTISASETSADGTIDFLADGDIQLIGGIEAGVDLLLESANGSIAGLNADADGDIDFEAAGTIGFADVASDSGNVTISAGGNIALETLSGIGATLTSTGGAVSVDTDINLADTLVASGTGIFLRSTNDLAVQATATDDNIDVETAGNLDVLGATAPGGIALSSTGGSTTISQQVTSTGGDISISGATDVLIGQDVNASGNLAIDAGNLVDVQALASGVLIDIISSDVAIASTGSIGESDRTTGITFTANSDEVTLGGAGGSGTPYELDNDEFSRVFSGGDVTLNAIGLSTGGASVTIDDLDVVAGTGANATDGNIGQGGGLFVTGGSIDIVGEAVVTNAAADTTLGLTASNDIFLDAATGLLEVQVDTGDYTGSILIEAENFYAMTADALADIQGLGIAEIDTRLADSDGLDNAEGVIRAGTLDITTIASDVFIQNTAPGTEFDERRGFTVDQLIISDLGNDPQPIVINGVIAGTTGIDAIPLADIGSNFDPGSTINGCLIADPASCIVTTSNPNDPSGNPVRELVEEQIEPENPAGESVLSMIIEFREDPERAPDPLIDEPVTGAGNEDLWFVEESEEEDECTEADPELCPAE